MDNYKEFIGPLFGVLGLIVPVVIYLLTRRKVEVAYGIILNESVFRIPEAIRQRINIRFDAHSVSDLCTICLGIKNSGNREVPADAFNRPLSLEIPEPGRLINAEVEKQYPENIGAEISCSENAVTLQPLLLNPGDFVTIRIFYTGDERSIPIDLRIAGTKLIQLKQSPKGNTLFDKSTSYQLGAFTALTFWSTLGALIGVSLVWLFTGLFMWQIVLWALFGATVSSVSMIFTNALSKYIRRKRRTYIN